MDKQVPSQPGDGQQPAAGNNAAAKPVTPPAARDKVKALYARLFPVDSPQRKSGPFIVAGAVLIILLLAKCGMSAAGDKISAVSQARAEEKRVRTTGVLVVKSNRPEATAEATRIVTADDPATDRTQGALGQALANLTPGKYAVTVHATGWPDAHGTVDVPAGQQAEITINFLSGSLRLDSDPAGAMVRLGGNTLGKTPLVIPDLPPGECQLFIEYPSWPAVAFKTTITANVESTGSVHLPHGKLTVDSSPQGATVLLGTKAFGQTPLTLERVSAGPKKLTLQAKDFPNLEVSVTVEDGGEAKIRPLLGSGFPVLNPEALLRAVWVKDDPNRLAPPLEGSIGPSQPQNGIIKNLNRKRVYEGWLRKRYCFTATVKGYDRNSGQVEFAEQTGDLSKYRVLAKLSAEARDDKELAAQLTKGATFALYGRLTAVEEPRWPGKVITLELSAAEALR